MGGNKHVVGLYSIIYFDFNISSCQYKKNGWHIFCVYVKWKQVDMQKKRGGAGLPYLLMSLVAIPAKQRRELHRKIYVYRVQFPFIFTPLNPVSNSLVFRFSKQEIIIIIANSVTRWHVLVLNCHQKFSDYDETKIQRRKRCTEPRAKTTKEPIRLHWRPKACSTCETSKHTSV